MESAERSPGMPFRRPPLGLPRNHLISFKNKTRVSHPSGEGGGSKDADSVVIAESPSGPPPGDTARDPFGYKLQLGSPNWSTGPYRHTANQAKPKLHLTWPGKSTRPTPKRIHRIPRHIPPEGSALGDSPSGILPKDHWVGSLQGSSPGGYPEGQPPAGQPGHRIQVIKQGGLFSQYFCSFKNYFPTKLSVGVLFSQGFC